MISDLPRPGLIRYGWQISQSVRPWNSPKLVPTTAERAYRPNWREAEDRPDVPRALRTESPSLVALMRMTREEWDQWMRGLCGSTRPG